MELPSSTSSQASICPPTIQITSCNKSKSTTISFSQRVLNSQINNSEPTFAILPTAPNYLPSRKREEAQALENLRKRLKAARLESCRPEPPPQPQLSPTTKNNNFTSDELDNRNFLLQKILSTRPMSMVLDISDLRTAWQDSDFISECLCWHNVYRQRHNSPTLTMSAQLHTVKCIVDSKPPTLNYNIKIQMFKDQKRAWEIDRGNKKILKTLTDIDRRGGLTDCFNERANLEKDLHWREHRKNMLRIQEENKRIFHKLNEVRSIYSHEILAKEWDNVVKEMKKTAKFPLDLNGENMDEKLKSEPSISGGLPRLLYNRPECYLEFSVLEGESLGRILVELYEDHVPATVTNFLEILQGKSGLSYVNCPVHRIVKGRYLETGDITKGTGRGGYSIYGKHFREENHKLKHSRTGVLTMVRIDNQQKNNSRFAITFASMPEWDRKNVVFGKVTKGSDTLTKISQYGRIIGKPLRTIYISACGRLPPCDCKTDKNY